MWIRVIALSISVLLNGCAAIVIAGAAAGMVVYDHREISMIEHDTRSAYKINHKIVKNKAFDSSRVVVSSFNRVVLLVGQVANSSLRIKAAQIAKAQPGVSRVYNEIKVAPPITVTQQTKDTWITSQVKASMMTKKGLRSGSVKVVTEDNVVYLMGKVSHDQANLAVDVARRIDGVKKVVKVFLYAD